MKRFEEGGVGAIEALLRRERRGNQRARALRPWSWWLDSRALEDWSGRLQQAREAYKPGVVHMAWSPPVTPAQAEPFELIHCLPIVAALAHHPDAQIMLHASARPSGRYWRWLEPKVTLVPWPRRGLFGDASRRETDINATLVRLLALDRLGGISPTNDGLLLRNCDDLRERRFVVSTRVMTESEPGGLTTDLMAAPPKHTVTRALLKAMAGGAAAVTLNAALYASYVRVPAQVRVLPSWECGMLARPVARKFLFDAVPDRFGPVMDDTARLLPLWRATLGEGWQGSWAREIERAPGLLATHVRTAIAGLPNKDRTTIRQLLDSDPF